MPQAISLPSSVRGKLSGARARLRAVGLALGLARAILALAVGLLVLFVLDYSLEPPLPVVRAFALFLALVAAAVSTVFLAIPIRRRLSDDDVALMVEREFPELHDGLVSAVQLSRASGQDDGWTSPALVRATVERAERDAAALDFGRVVRTGPLLPLWVAIVAFSAGGVLFSQRENEVVAVFARRVVLGEDLGYPKQVELRVGNSTLAGASLDEEPLLEGGVRVLAVAPNSPAEEIGLQVGDVIVALEGQPLADRAALFDLLLGRRGGQVSFSYLRGQERLDGSCAVGNTVPAAVAKGDDVTVDVYGTKGSILVDGLLATTRYPEERRVEVRDVVQLGPGHFRKTFQNVTQPFAFRVQDPGSGVRSRTYSVQVVQRPRIEGYHFALVYPEYTELTDETVSQPDLQVPAGTEVTYAVVANQAIERSKLVFEFATIGRDDRGRRRRTVMTELGVEPLRADRLGASAFAEGGDWAALGEVVAAEELLGDLADQTLIGSFRVDRDTRFRFDLVSEAGYPTGKKPVVFTIQAVADQKPAVSIPVPGRRKQVTERAEVPLRVDAKDDYGVMGLELRLRAALARDPDTTQAEETIELTAFELGDREVQLDYTLDLAEQKLRPGDRLIYSAVAYDANVDESQRAKRTREYELDIVSEADMQNLLQARVERLKEQLKLAAVDQREARARADEFMPSLGPKGTLSDDDRRTLQRVSFAQRKVGDRLSKALDEVKDLAQERRLNRLDDEVSMRLLSDLEEGTEELSQRASPQVVRELDEARNTPALADATKAKLSRVPDLQEQIAQAIDALVQRIDKYGDFEEVLREWRNLSDDQGRILKDAEEAVRSRGGD